MRVPVEDMMFVIRAAGERTEGACIQLVRRLVEEAGGDAGAQVEVVRERPFAAAVRRTFQIGMGAGRAWVVAMDADVLLLGDAIERIGAMCACADGAVFTITPRVLCRFFGGFCCRGLHAYPARLLGRAMAEIDASGTERDLRPEGAVSLAMDAKGFRLTGPPVVVGIHDYEQSFRHIYLKARLRGQREAADAGQPYSDSLPFVSGRAAMDADYLVAKWGLEDGHEDAGRTDAPTYYDWDGSYPELARRMRERGIVEKGALEGGDGDGGARGMAERVIGSHDFAADVCTPAWVRERFGFAGDRQRVLARMGVAEHACARAGATCKVPGVLRRAS